MKLYANTIAVLIVLWIVPHSDLFGQVETPHLAQTSILYSGAWSPEPPIAIGTTVST
jgi:hypothetical protein